MNKLFILILSDKIYIINNFMSDNKFLTVDNLLSPPITRKRRSKSSPEVLTKKHTRKVSKVLNSKVLASSVIKSNNLKNDVESLIHERDKIIIDEVSNNFRELKITDGPIKLPHRELRISPKRTQLEDELEQFNSTISLPISTNIDCLKYCITLEDLILEKTKDLKYLGNNICCWFCTRSRKKWGGKQPLTVPIKYVESYYEDIYENQTKIVKMEEENKQETETVGKTMIIKKYLSKRETLKFLKSIIINNILISDNGNNSKKNIFNDVDRWNRDQIVNYIEKEPHLIKNLKLRDYFVGIGIVCSFSCMISYHKLHEKEIIYKDTFCLIKKMYNFFFPDNRLNFTMSISGAPSPHCLKKFGGETTNEEYEKLLICYSNNNKPNIKESSIIKINSCQSNFKTRALKDVYLMHQD